ncbi:MAG: hypothetical protein JJU05_04755 [Verrucomicrobia bacterium]|nr:hypothetical protein [Verrucomicrobiota bacterium]MCH8526843.1 hypothetical protein [Kiritimatiellia bacterium]
MEKTTSFTTKLRSVLLLWAATSAPKRMFQSFRILSLLTFAFAEPLHAEVNILIIGSGVPGDIAFASTANGFPARTPAFRHFDVADHLRQILEGAGHGAVNVTTREHNAVFSFSRATNLFTWFHWPYGTGGRAARWADLRGEGDTAWDYVVLIGDTYTIETTPGLYTLGVANVAAEVAKGSGQTVLLMPWPAPGSTSNLDHYKEVVYRTGRTAGIPVAPAGLAWQAAGSPADTIHPTQDEGAYLAAATLYSRLFGQSAANSSYNPFSSLANTAHTTVTENQGAPQYSGKFEFNNPFKMLGDKRRHVYHSERGTSTERDIRRWIHDWLLPELNLTRSFTHNTYNSNTPDDDGRGWPQNWPLPTAFNLGRHMASASDANTKSYFTNRAFWQLGFGYSYQFESSNANYIANITTRDLDLAYLMKEGTTSRTSYNLNAYDSAEEIASARLIPLRLLCAIIDKEFPNENFMRDSTHISHALARAGGTFVYALYSGRTPVEDELRPAGSAIPNPELNNFAQRVGYETAWILGNVQARAPGFKVTPATSNASAASELLSVRFLFPPQEDVTVHIAVSDPSRGEVSPETLLFTPENYRVPQEVSSRALNNSSVLSGGYEVLFTTTSDDEVYDDLDDAWSFSMPDNAAPAIGITSPSEGQNFPVGTDLTVSVNASDPDGSVAHVTLWINDAEVRQINTAPFQWSPANGDNLLAGLVEDQYTLRIRAVDNLGTAHTVIRSSTVGDPESNPPPAPSGVIATAFTDSVAIAWDASSLGKHRDYSIYRTTTPGAFGEPLATKLTSNLFTDLDVVRNTAYYYVVTATDIFGNESVFSAEVEAVPALPGTVSLDVRFGTNNDRFAGFTEAATFSPTGWTEQSEGIRYVNNGSATTNWVNSSLLRQYPLDRSAGSAYLFSGTIDVTSMGPSSRASRVGLSLFAGSGGVAGINSGLSLIVIRNGNLALNSRGINNFSSPSAQPGYSGSVIGGGVYIYRVTVHFNEEDADVAATVTDFNGVSQTVTLTVPKSLLAGEFFGFGTRSRTGGSPAFVIEPQTFSISELNMPDVPTGLTAVPNDGFVSLSWDANDDPHTATYRLYRRQGSGAFPSTALASDIPGTAFQDNEAEGGILYGYAVSAVAEDGTESELSEPVELTYFPNLNPPSVSAGSAQTIPFSSATAWSPAEMPGIVGWYDASDAATLTADGGSVSQWADKSGNELHLTQSEAARRPATGATTINGTNAIKFDGVDDRLNTSTNPFGSSVNDAFVLAVHRVDARVSNQTLFSLTGSSENANRWQSHAPWGSEIFFDTGGTGAERLRTNYDVSVGDVVLAGFYGSTTDNVQQIFKNGSLLAGDNSGHSVNTAGNLFVGGIGNHYQNTAIGEFILLNGTVSTADRQKLEGYLAHKWGLAGLLPVNHPYEDEAPAESRVAATLGGAVSDPDGNALTTIWSLLSGPAPVTFDNPAVPGTSVTFEGPGVYVFQLTATDGLYTTHDEVTFTVLPTYEDWLENTTLPDPKELDGVPPYFLYLAGWSQGEAVGGAGRLFITEPSGENGPAFSWEVLSGFEPGPDFEIWTSTDLVDWTRLVPGEGALVPHANPATGRTRYELRLDLPKVFIRLQGPSAN